MASPSVAAILPTVEFAILLAAVGVSAVFLLRRYLTNRSHLRGGEEAIITLLVTIPRFKTEEDAKGNEGKEKIKEQIAVAEAVYAAIGGLHPHRTLHSWFAGRTDAVALEIVVHKRLISFYVSLPRTMQQFVEQQIHAQWSDAHFEEVADYNLFSPHGVLLGGYLTLKRKNVFPIKTYKELESDPLNAITNTLSKVAEGDGVAIQYIIRPTHHTWRDIGARIVRRMKDGAHIHEAERHWIFGEGSWSTNKETREKDEQKKHERKLSQAEEKMLEGIENKISKAGMEVNIRIVACASTPDAAKSYLNNVLSAYNQFNIYEFGNSFSKVIPRGKEKLIHHFIHRKFSQAHSIILNAEEMSGLWHLPLPSTETPNIRWMLARTAPAPAGLPTSGLFLGTNMFRGVKTDIFLQDADRRRHSYIIGKTGSGKSEFIKNLAIQDIRNGKGVCVIDPHGDLANGLMELIPDDRIDDVIYFNPADKEKPMGLNMLEFDGTETDRDKVIKEMISIFYMLFDAETMGPMFQHCMRNYMATLMADVNNLGTIVEIPHMIADAEFQKKWSARVTDHTVRTFWDDEMANTSDHQKSEMLGYLVSKVGPFVEDAMMRNIIGQAQSSFNFLEVMDTGKILLVNLSKGQIGEMNANLLGLVIVAKLQMAVFKRANIPEKDRRDFYLYIDEFQNFITPSIATILSEARKYRLSLILAHQYMGQLVKDGKTEIRDAILGNVGSFFVARVGPEDTEVLAKIYEPTFSGYDLMNTDAYTWNLKMIHGNAQVKPFTLKAPPTIEGTQERFEGLKQISRLMYGRDREDVAAEIAERAGYNKAGKKGPDIAPTAEPAPFGL